MRLITTLFALLFAASAAYAQERLPISKIDVTEYGIYKLHTTSISRGIDVLTRLVRHVEVPPKNIESATTIPGRLGLEFGFKYKPVGEREGEQVALDCVTRFPEAGVRHPITRKIHHEDHFNCNVVVGKEAFRGYIFRHKWEIVPGIWALEFWYQGHKLGGQEFTVAAQ